MSLMSIIIISDTIVMTVWLYGQYYQTINYDPMKEIIKDNQLQL